MVLQRPAGPAVGLVGKLPRLCAKSFRDSIFRQAAPAALVPEPQAFPADGQRGNASLWPGIDRLPTSLRPLFHRAGVTQVPTVQRSRTKAKKAARKSLTGPKKVINCPNMLGRFGRVAPDIGQLFVSSVFSYGYTVRVQAGVILRLRPGWLPCRFRWHGSWLQGGSRFPGRRPFACQVTAAGHRFWARTAFAHALESTGLDGNDSLAVFGRNPRDVNTR